jgi:hypothetical protein
VKKDQPSNDAISWDARAIEALEKARLMPPGQERSEALKKAGILRNATDLRGLFFAKHDRPPNN